MTSVAAPEQRELESTSGVDVKGLGKVNGRSTDPQFSQFYEMDPLEDLLLYQGRERTPEEIVEYNRLHVLPFNPLIYFDCHEESVDIFGYGAVATQCNGIREYPLHPYFDETDDSLIGLAEYDAAAAVIYAHRAFEPDQVFDYSVRGAALSGRPGPLLKGAYHRFGGDLRAEIMNSNQVEAQDLSNYLMDRVVLETIAQKMGDPRAKPSWVVRLAREKFGEFDQAELRQRVDLTLSKMNEIRRDVLGAAPIGLQASASPSTDG